KQIQNKNIKIPNICPFWILKFEHCDLFKISCLVFRIFDYWLLKFVWLPACAGRLYLGYWLFISGR
ncbi:MAG: hypothetical protein V1770_00840, partial [bacterium]